MPKRRGVWIAGPSRSGTSMVAGLFAAHGVFFGNCVNGDEFNPKGYFEHAWLKRFRKKELPDNWPVPWWRKLKNEGWTTEPWGVKGGPQMEPIVRPMNPAVVVVCRRPLEDIATSRQRVPWAKDKPDSITTEMYSRLDTMIWPRRIISVRTPLLVAGKFADIRPAFRILGIDFDHDIARAWIDPSVWGRKV